MISLLSKKRYTTWALLLFTVELCISLKASGFVRHTLGDYLAVIFVYCCIRSITTLSINRAAMLTLGFAYTLEFLQSTTFLEFLQLQQYKLAQMLFGTTFSMGDLVAYTLGVVSILIIERNILKKLHRHLKLKHKLVAGGLLLGALLVVPNYIVAKSAKNLTYYNINDIPKNKVGLILGASKFTKNGKVNLYYWYRVKAAAQLYHAGKIQYILASGDNGVKTYNEPTTFKNDLLALGVPKHRIFLDYAGFRTLDSVIRAKKVFGLDSYTVISQRFHNQRAIFIANQYNIAVVGFNARHVKKSQFFNKPIREYLARAKAVLDIITHKQPKFLGKPISIP